MDTLGGSRFEGRALVFAQRSAVLTSVGGMLRNAGLDVVVAAGRQQALAALRDCDIDLIVMDLQHPDGAIDLYAAVTCVAPALATKVIVMTGGVRENRQQWFLEVFTGRVLLKPFRTVDMRHALESVMRVVASVRPSGTVPIRAGMVFCGGACRTASLPASGPSAPSSSSAGAFLSRDSPMATVSTRATAVTCAMAAAAPTAAPRRHRRETLPASESS